MFKIVVRLGADVVIVAIALFASAGTFRWWQAWVLLAVLFAVRVVGARVVFRVNPGLLLERAKSPIRHGQSLTDRVLVLAVLGVGFVGLPVVAGLERFRWQLLPPPGSLCAALGLLLFASGWVIKSLALRANAFAVAAVRIQRERGHEVLGCELPGYSEYTKRVPHRLIPRIW